MIAKPQIIQIIETHASNDIFDMLKNAECFLCVVGFEFRYTLLKDLLHASPVVVHYPGQIQILFQGTLLSLQARIIARAIGGINVV